jgi:hypothetical protein
MEYLSLYDYLGKAAGEQLGLEVSMAAKQAGIKIGKNKFQTQHTQVKFKCTLRNSLNFTLENQILFIWKIYLDKLTLILTMMIYLSRYGQINERRI